MSPSSDIGPAARRTTRVLGMLAVVLLATVGGVLVTATTSGAAWVEPPLEAPIAACEAEASSAAPAPRRVTAATPRPSTRAGDCTPAWPRRALAAAFEPGPEDPPPGRSPPMR